MPLECGGCRPLIGTRPGEHHRPRGIEGALSVCVLRMWNVETPSGSSPRGWLADCEEGSIPAGNRMTREANAGTPKGDGKDSTDCGHLLAGWGRTGRIRAVCSAREGCPRGSGEFVRRR